MMQNKPLQDPTLIHNNNIKKNSQQTTIRRKLHQFDEGHI